MKNSVCCYVCFLSLLAFILVLLFGQAPASALQKIKPRLPARVVVLTGHDVVPLADPQNPAQMTPFDLHANIRALKGAGYHFLTPDAFHEFLDGKLPLSGTYVLLTFDDGYQSAAAQILPVLKQYRVSPILFPVAKWYTPAPRPETKANPHLSAQETAELLQNGWTLGGHSYDGHRVLNVSQMPFYTGWLPDESDGAREARIYADLLLNQKVLEDLQGNPSLDLAWPFGAYNATTVRLAREAGFRYLYTTRPGVVTLETDPLAIPRVALHADPQKTLEAIKKALSFSEGEEFTDAQYEGRLPLNDINLPPHES